MKPRNARPKPLLTAMLLPLLLLGCGHASPLLKPTAGAQIPPLPVQARQPASPPECLPTCSANARSEFERWLTTLTGQPEQDKPAKPATTR